MAAAVFEQARPEDYLLRLAASGLGQSYKRLAMSELRIIPGCTVLDLGCGPGADLPVFGDAVGAGGAVIGLDHDPNHVDQASARTAGMPQVNVRRCDIHVLDVADRSVDRVHTDRVLQHVADPQVALKEAFRVLRPGGRAVFAEPDWETLVIDYPDLAVARSYTRFVADQVVRHASIGRQLPRLSALAGFELHKVIPITAVFHDAGQADQVLGLHRVTARAVDAGYLTSNVARDWLTYLATQPFFASATLFIAVATKQGA
jgi:ubiquinone/menaquinone biosynthesis C-methylase UbiE